MGGAACAAKILLCGPPVAQRVASSMNKAVAVAELALSDHGTDITYDHLTELQAAVCECERSDEPNLSQTLVLTNGEFIQQRIASPEGRLAKLLASGKSYEAILRELYLRALARRPTPEEVRKAKSFLGAGASREQSLQDLLWTLLNSREFLLQH